MKYLSSIWDIPSYIWIISGVFFSHSATWTVSEIQETAHMIHGIVKQHQSTNERKKHEHVFFSSSRGNWWAATVLMIPFTQVLCQLGILLMVLSYESFPAHRSKLKNWPSNPVETPVDPRNAVRWPHRHPQIRCCRRMIIATKGGGYWLFDLFIYRVFPAFVSWLSWVGAWRGEVHPWESTVTS